MVRDAIGVNNTTSIKQNACGTRYMNLVLSSLLSLCGLVVQRPEARFPKVSGSIPRGELI